jgi:Uma2 family endonuclease
MSSASTDSSTPQAPPFEVPARRVPTLDELYAMTSVPEERVVIPDVDWAFYEQLVDSIPAGAGIHADYDGKDVEIMSIGQFHDCVKKRMGRFAELVAEELEIPCIGLGQSTRKRAAIARGLEADECYCFAAEKLTMIAEAVARFSEELADYPNPDLGVEVDVSPPKIDRPGIYAALSVAEVWRYDGKRRGTVIERLTAGGTYEPIDQSGFLPVRPEEVDRWVLQEDARDGSQWARRLRAWARDELALRLAR